MRESSLILAVAFLVLSGCSGDPPIAGASEDPAAGAASPTQTTDGAEAGVPAPVWQAGDWWTWKVTTVDADPFEVTTVVTSVTAQEYRVGVTDLGPGLHAFTDHTLPMGVLQRADLSWEVHDEKASVIRFPLEPGMSWSGEEEGRDLRFTASATTVATPWGEMPAIEGTGVTEARPDRPGIRFVYLPAIGNFASYSLYTGGERPYATATWLSNGTGGGEATVVESDDAFHTGDGLPPPPDLPDVETRLTFSVSAKATHVMLACFLGGQGTQQANAISPRGAALSCKRGLDAPTNQTLIRAIRAAEAGSWTVRTTAAGGHLYLEVYALTLSVERPS
jgi:hypothetical protein